MPCRGCRCFERGDLCGGEPFDDGLEVASLRFCEGISNEGDADEGGPGAGVVDGVDGAVDDRVVADEQNVSEDHDVGGVEVIDELEALVPEVVVGEGVEGRGECVGVLLGDGGGDAGDLGVAELAEEVEAIDPEVGDVDGVDELDDAFVGEECDHRIEVGEIFDVAGDADDDGVVVDGLEDGGDDIGGEVPDEVGEGEAVSALEERGGDLLHGLQVELVDEVADAAGVGAGGDVGHEVDAEVLGVLAAALGVDEADQSGAEHRTEPLLADARGESGGDELAGRQDAGEALGVGRVEGVADLPAEVAERLDGQAGEELDLGRVDVEERATLARAVSSSIVRGAGAALDRAVIGRARP